MTVLNRGTRRSSVRTVRRASLRDTVRMVAGVLAPPVASGVLLRRPWLLRWAERVDLDGYGIRALAGLRARYGDGPLRMAAPFGRFTFLLSAPDVVRVLAESPEPFALATREKKAALRHFQPHGVLISPNQLRPVRRPFNEAVLDADQPVHRLGDAVARAVSAELAALAAGELPAGGRLVWPDFRAAVERIVRRVVLGGAARDDKQITETLDALRSTGNWTYARPRRPRLRRRFADRIERYLLDPDPDSLAGQVARTPAPPGTDPAGQVPQWLFAFDAAGIATFRALAVLAVHPRERDRARAEVVDRDLSRAQYLPYLRACVLESVRLWPTTLVILRETTSPTRWASATLPAGNSLVILSAYFHRDASRLPYADRFIPQIWLDGRAEASESLVPFSDGPGACPGRNLVLLMTSLLLGGLLRRYDFRPEGASRLDPGHPLPGTFNHTAITLIAGPR